jgi:hypothetical protein
VPLRDQFDDPFSTLKVKDCFLPLYGIALRSKTMFLERSHFGPQQRKLMTPPIASDKESKNHRNNIPIYLNP